MRYSSANETGKIIIVPNFTNHYINGEIRMIKSKFIFVKLIPILLSTTLSACSGSKQQTDLNMAPMSGMPAEIQSAPVSVQQAYQFAVGNPDVMQQIPCYCGCGSIGHTSNYSCYVSSVDSKGAITYDNHALGCSLCVDITQDTMRQLKDGKTVQEIKANVDSAYSKYGTSNMP
jgi:hypothetical protein